MASLDRVRLFRASCVTMFVGAMGSVLRSEAMRHWGADLHLTNEQVGRVSGAAFWGLTAALLGGGALCNAVGMRRLTGFSFAAHVVGALLIVTAPNFTLLYAGVLLFGLANGTIEGVCNPLVATLYPNDQTTRLNRVGVWFPAGGVVGGLLAFTLSHWTVSWRLQFACILLPVLIYGMLFARQQFPTVLLQQRDRSFAGMARACLDPLFLLLLLGMFLASAAEFGPMLWAPKILSFAGVPGILVLAWISAVMAVGRRFAGFFVHRVGALGLLIGSSVTTALGLHLLSVSQGAMLWVSSTVFALGSCYFFTTLLGLVGEFFPRTGPLGFSVMAASGMLSVATLLPQIGRLYDSGITARLPGGSNPAAMASVTPGSELATTWSRVQAEAGLEALGKLVVIPIVLVGLFLVVLAWQRLRARSAT